MDHGTVNEKLAVYIGRGAQGNHSMSDQGPSIKGYIDSEILSRSDFLPVAFVTAVTQRYCFVRLESNRSGNLTGVDHYSGRVLVMTSDGRVYVGILKSCDQATNLVLDQTIERVYSSDVCSS